MRYYKIGDRVRLIRRLFTGRSSYFNFGAIYPGEMGTVRNPQDGYSILVEFDRHIHGHDGEGVGRYGHCWYVEPDDIIYDIRPMKKIPNYYFALPF
jgi:hypothetical protein